MQRRIYDYSQYTHLKGLQPMNQFMTISLFVLGAAQVILVLNFFLSMRRGKVAGPNPWRANTLEWQTSSPPPHENFTGQIPTVYRGPYEYSVPERSEDYWPQNEPPAGAERGACVSHALTPLLPGNKASGSTGSRSLTAAATLFLIFAGGLVTSTESGLSVPDWPHVLRAGFTARLDGGRGLLRARPSNGGHDRRDPDDLPGDLAFPRGSRGAWVRRLGYAALAAVVAQGVLGGLTVIFLLPTAVSVAHACLAQTFFCLVVTIAVVTSPRVARRGAARGGTRSAADRRRDGGPDLPSASGGRRDASHEGRARDPRLPAGPRPILSPDHVVCGRDPLRAPRDGARRRGGVRRLRGPGLASGRPALAGPPSARRAGPAPDRARAPSRSCRERTSWSTTAHVATGRAGPRLDLAFALASRPLAVPPREARRSQAAPRSRRAPAWESSRPPRSPPLRRGPPTSSSCRSPGSRLSSWSRRRWATRSARRSFDAGGLPGRLCRHAMVAGGASALNQYAEREATGGWSARATAAAGRTPLAGRGPRLRSRDLGSRPRHPRRRANLLTFALGLAALASYVLAYTPLKR